MHRGTNGLLTTLIEYFRVSQSFCNLGGKAQQAFGKAWTLFGPPLATVLLTALDLPLNLLFLLGVATNATGQRLHDKLIMVVYITI